MERNVVCECRWRETFRHRRRHNRVDAKRDFSRRLHVWLPLVAAFDRGISGCAVKISGVCKRLCLRELPESPSHGLGMDQFVLGWFHRCLYSPLLNGHLARFSIFLKLKFFAMPDYQILEYDVLVIGAGGAGLRAAIEASAADVKV